MQMNEKPVTDSLQAYLHLRSNVVRTLPKLSVNGRQKDFEAEYAQEMFKLRQEMLTYRPNAFNNVRARILSLVRQWVSQWTKQETEALEMRLLAAETYQLQALEAFDFAESDSSSNISIARPSYDTVHARI